MSDTASYRDFVPLKPLSRSTRTDERKTYYYNDEPVEIVVAFDEGDEKIAIVENSHGEQFDVPMRELRSA